jgi:hypothetical protein
MNILLELVNALDSKTIGHIQRRIDEPDSKLSLLLKAYRKGDPDDEKIARTLYGKESNALNALYRLKSRLVHLIDELLIDISSAEGDDSFIAERHLMLFQIFKEKRQLNLALYHLKKAEKFAGTKEQYYFLDIIYNEFIVFTKDLLVVDPEVYLKKRRTNDQMLSNIKTIDEILALISYRLRVTQNMSDKFNVTKEIEAALGNFAGDQEIFKSPQFKIKFYKTISQILVQEKKYEELEKYLESSYKDFTKAGLFNKQTHDIKTEQLVYWGNALLMQGKYDSAIEKSKSIEEALNEYQGVLREKYIYFVYQLQINAYAVIDLDKAADLLQKVVSSKEFIVDPYHNLINFANLTFIYFVQKKFKLVIKTLQTIYRNEFFENTDMHMKAQLAILELLTRYELEEVDNFEYRLKQIEKSFKTEWKDYAGIDKDLLTLAKLMFYSPGYRSNLKLKAMAETYLKENEHNQNRIFNYDIWVREKFGRKKN